MKFSITRGDSECKRKMGFKNGLQAVETKLKITGVCGRVLVTGDPVSAQVRAVAGTGSRWQGLCPAPKAGDLPGACPCPILRKEPLSVRVSSPAPLQSGAQPLVPSRSWEPQMQDFMLLIECDKGFFVPTLKVLRMPRTSDKSPCSVSAVGLLKPCCVPASVADGEENQVGSSTGSWASLLAPCNQQLPEDPEL